MDNTGDGMYWVDPDGLGALEVYCDMTNDGGGWTLLVQDGASCQFTRVRHTMTNLLSPTWRFVCIWMTSQFLVWPVSELMSF